MLNKTIMWIILILAIHTATCLECYTGTCENCKPDSSVYLMKKEKCEGLAAKCITKIIFNTNDEDMNQVKEIIRMCGDFPLGCNKEHFWNKLYITCACTDRDLCNGPPSTTNQASPSFTAKSSGLVLTIGCLLFRFTS